MTSERDAFGPTLKAERDRRGITLSAIAESTKIGVSLLAALERNDLSRWPKGIFRRAFVREYAIALGLPPEPVVAEFIRRFPDAAEHGETNDSSELRLTFELAPSTTWFASRARLLVAVVELAGVMGLGVAAAWWLQSSFWAASGVVALLYYPAASVFIERTPTPRLLYQPAALRRWLRAPVGAWTRLGSAWSGPALSVPKEPDAADAAGTPATSEWRAVSH